MHAREHDGCQGTPSRVHMEIIRTVQITYFKILFFIGVDPTIIFMHMVINVIGVIDVVLIMFPSCAQLDRGICSY